ncbi:hypothetical protein AWW66_16080 [Micromonospora rosaria]|uniref:DUF4407 domain-containing protein n=1 Tax=Micromonospora rosaria TaxID=47874 RepID=A0A136PR83_9ACTN|nr:hypothetical protein AWW66_16080 [Micromonospora rosaria]
MDETVLRRVWHERARHTALGGTILGTALIAAFSMWFAVNQVIGRQSPWSLVPAAVWFLFILNFDRQIVTSMAGNMQRAGAMLARLALSLMIGFVVAEPLIMRIFETAIEEHIKEQRSTQLDTLRTSLLSCNGEKAATAEDTSTIEECRGYLLSFAQTPGSIRRELTGTRAEAKEFQGVVDRESGQLRTLRDAAAKECAGGRGTGFTGRPGDGPRCRQRTADADEYARTHPIEENTRKLADLRGRIVDLEEQLAGAVTTFEKTRDDQIAERVEQERRHQGPIGFLERLDALHDLSTSSAALFVSTWAVRLFFVAVDCLPMMAKFLSGASGYDRLYRVRSESRERIFTEEAATEERRFVDQYSAEREEIDNQARMRRAEHELTLQEHQVLLRSRRDRAVNDLADKLLREPRRQPTDPTDPASPATRRPAPDRNGQPERDVNAHVAF